MGQAQRPNVRRFLSLILLLGATLPLFGSIAWAEPDVRYQLADLKALQNAFVSLAAKVQPSVVSIVTYKVRDVGSEISRAARRRYSQGSGFIISEDGFVATNRHVIEGSDIISVILHNGLKFDAELIQSDPRSDLAVVRIDVDNLSAVRLGDAAEVHVNQWVFASGNPFGLGNVDGRTSVTYGVISAMGRKMTRRLVGDSEIEYYGNMLETSATINPGNSGGPLFDIDGKVIGVVTAIETESGVSEGHGFAIPMDRNVRRILDTLMSGELVRYGFLGVTVADGPEPRRGIVRDLRTRRGARLDMISLVDGPAAKAGLRRNDLVVEYDGHPVEDSDHLVRLVQYTPVGTSVLLVYVRKGVKRRTTVTVADRMVGLAQAFERNP